MTAMSVGVVVLAVLLAAAVGLCGVLAVRQRRARRSLRRLAEAPELSGPPAAGATRAVVGPPTDEVVPATEPPESARLSEAIDLLARRLRGLEHSGRARSEWIERLSETISRMTEGVVICNGDGEVTFREGAAFASVSSRHGRALMDAAVDRVLGRACEGVTVREEVRLHGPPQRVFMLSASPLAGGGLALVEDVTERELVEALRRDFVANIGHELRTPVGAISLLAETLEGLLSDFASSDGPASSDAEDRTTVMGLARRLVVEAERMTRTIDDLAELSRVESETNGERNVVALQGVVNATVERLANAAEQQEISINVATPAAPINLLADRRQIASAAHNLLDNAIKYSPRGATVSVRIRCDDRWAELSVQDTGIGIPQADLHRIFERFYRVDRSRTTASGGIGLGLAIVRHVAINHGGDVDVQSLEGEGSTFTLRLPTVVADDGNPTGDRPEVAFHGEAAGHVDVLGANESAVPDEPGAVLPGLSGIGGGESP